jgi:hypothetical protein
MVFIRLTVKVYPLGWVSIASMPGRYWREADTEGNSAASMQPVSFLLVLQRPEEVALRVLASMIQEK